MIQSIRLINFQSHKDSFIEFSPNDTVLIGTSNSGKTAVLRALDWILKNRPLGTSFIRHGASECVVDKSAYANCRLPKSHGGNIVLRSLTVNQKSQSGEGVRHDVYQHNTKTAG